MLAMLMLRTTTSNLLQTVAHENLIVGSGKERSSDVHEDTNPRIILVAEDLATEEDGRDHAGTEVPCQVGRDGNVRETDRD